LITSIEVKNFQSIGALTLELGNLTVVSGPSNSGKSAVVRALRALVTNPRGSAAVRDGEEYCRVIVAGVDWPMSQATADPDTFAIGYEKTAKGTPSYAVEVVSLNGAHDEEFTAIGNDVPELVMDLLALDPDQQVADQFDPPYLVAVTPSAAARVLDALSKAEVIGSAVTVANRQQGEHKRSAKAYEESMATLQARLDVLLLHEDNLKDMLATARGITEALDEYRFIRNETAQAVVKVSALRQRIQAAQARREVLAQANLSTALARMAALRQLKHELGTLRAEVGDLAERHAVTLASLRRVEHELGGIHSDVLVDCPLCTHPTSVQNLLDGWQEIRARLAG
jgi:exonuclease SbcC